MAYFQHVSVPRPFGAAAQASAFYGGVVGLTEKPVPDSLTVLDINWFAIGTDGHELHVFSAETRPITSQHFCLIVDDLEEMRQRLLEAGLTPEAPTDISERGINSSLVIPGRPRFFCRDPFGNLVEYTTIGADYQL